MRRWRGRLQWIRPSRQSLAAAAVGAAMLGAVAAADPRLWGVAVAGAAGVAVATLGRWPVAGTGAVVAALVTSGTGVLTRTSPLPLTVACALLVLAYLLMLDVAESAMPGITGNRARAIMLTLLAGAAAALVTSAASAATLSGSFWLTMTGVLATCAALVAAAI